jgi:hypothetical protein
VSASAQLKLLDGREVSVTDDMVKDAARDMEAGDGTRKEVEVNGKRVDALRLVADASGAPADYLKPVDAYRILHRLGFKFLGKTPQFEEDAKQLLRQYSEMDTTDAEESDDDEVDLTPEIAQQLQRHRGEWVAIHKGNVLRTAMDLHTLRLELGNAPATVVYVPLDKTATWTSG